MGGCTSGVGGGDDSRSQCDLLILRYATFMQHSSHYLVVSFNVAQRSGDIGVIEQALGQMNIALWVTHQVCSDGVPETVGDMRPPHLTINLRYMPSTRSVYMTTER